MVVNDNAGCLNPRGVPAFFASRLAPTADRGRPNTPEPPKKNGQPENRISRHSLIKSNSNHALSE